MNLTKNTMNDSGDDKKPWYRYGLVWFVIAIPAFAIISSVTIITISIVNYDDLVDADYYKRGKQINRVLARSAMATRLQLAAKLDVDPKTGIIELNLSSPRELGKQNITFKLNHTVFSRNDQAITLEHLGNNRYRGKLKSLQPGYWNITLETLQWRLDKRIRVQPGPANYQLKASPQQP